MKNTQMSKITDIQINDNEYLQSINDFAYNKFALSNNWDYADLINWLGENYGDLIKFTVLLASLNGQVCNGGIMQYYHNGYGDGHGGCMEEHTPEIPLFRETLKLADKYSYAMPSLIKLINISKNFKIEIDNDRCTTELCLDEEDYEYYEEEVINDNYGDILNHDELSEFDSKYYEFNADIINELEMFLKNTLKKS